MNERKFAVIGHPIGHTMSPLYIKDFLNYREWAEIILSMI